ncbi:hypothetical protein, partial [Streptomyces caniscabiei]|uniref:hypothetical protein n=1 Tax=Streptomyces caniscabiei TaxID=2746961 RepID=UPI00211ADF4C
MTVYSHTTAGSPRNSVSSRRIRWYPGPSLVLLSFFRHCSSRSPRAREVHYTSPDARQEIVGKASLARGDLL